MKIPTDIQSNMCPGCSGCCVNVSPQFGISKYDSKEALEKFAQEVDESFELSVTLIIGYIDIYGDPKYDGSEKLKKAAELLEDYVPIPIFSLVPKLNGRCYFLTDDNTCIAYNKSRPEICKEFFCSAVRNASYDFNTGLIPLEQILKTLAPHLNHAINRSQQV